MLYHDFHPHHCSLCRLVRENPAIVTHCMARPGGKRNETTSAVRRRLCNRRILESNETETPTSTVSPLRRSPTLCHCIAQAVASRIDRSECCCPIVGETEKSCGGKGQSLRGEKSHDPKLPQPRGALGSCTSRHQCEVLRQAESAQRDRSNTTVDAASMSHRHVMRLGAPTNASNFPAPSPTAGSSGPCRPVTISSCVPWQ